MKHQSYFTRALKARDPRYARIFAKLGYSTADLVADDSAAPSAPSLDINEMRDLYEEVFGKRPFNGWNAQTLSEKIAEKRAEG